MAKWDKINSKGKVEDRRGMKLSSGAGGIGLGGLALVLLVGYFGGGEQALQLFSQLNQPTTTTQITTEEFKGEDEYENFASKVLGSNNTLWDKAFGAINQRYTEPKLVLFRDATQSLCGGAYSQVGPHYCSADETIYLDERFFEEMKNDLGAQGGDVAQGYVIAHEVGHHVQNELGILTQAHNLMRNNSKNSNKYSIALELQADCFAGLWANSIRGEGVLEKGEILEAIDAAKSVGDDNIQKKYQGEIRPESWTHGSSDDRKKWFLTGYNANNIAACDTFNSIL